MFFFRIMKVFSVLSYIKVRGSQIDWLHCLNYMYINPSQNTVNNFFRDDIFSRFIEVRGDNFFAIKM